jgi:hypothetical protein
VSSRSELEASLEFGEEKRMKNEDDSRLRNSTATGHLAPCKCTGRAEYNFKVIIITLEWR